MYLFYQKEWALVQKTLVLFYFSFSLIAVIIYYFGKKEEMLIIFMVFYPFPPVKESNNCHNKKA